MDEKDAIRLLRKYASSERDFKEVLRHTKAMQKIALDIARTINRRGKRKADVELVRVGAMLHDIGRFDYPPWKCPVRHGVHGAMILKKEGLSAKYQRICSCHLGAGITAADVKKQNLPIPAKDYMPRTLEEKIICYADRRVRMTRKIRIETELARFRKFGKEAVARLQALHEEIQELMT